MRAGPPVTTFFENMPHVTSYWISLLTITFLAQIANIAEIILLRKKHKTLHIWLLLSLCATDILSSLCYSVIILLLIFLPKRIDAMYVFSGVFGIMLLSSWIHFAAIAIDRHIAVFYPLLHRIRGETRKMKTTVLLFVWSVTIILSVLFWLIVLRAGQKTKRLALLPSCVVVFLTGTCLLITYLLVIAKIIKQTKKRRKMQVNANRIKLHNATVENREMIPITNCLSVTLSFIICMYPNAVFWLMGRKSVPNWSVILLILSPCLNPITYCFVNHIRRFYINHTSHRSTSMELAP